MWAVYNTLIFLRHQNAVTLPWSCQARFDAVNISIYEGFWTAIRIFLFKYMFWLGNLNTSFFFLRATVVIFLDSALQPRTLFYINKTYSQLNKKKTFLSHMLSSLVSISMETDFISQRRHQWCLHLRKVEFSAFSRFTEIYSLFC